MKKLKYTRDTEFETLDITWGAVFHYGCKRITWKELVDFQRLGLVHASSWKSADRRGSSRVNWQKEGLKATSCFQGKSVSSAFTLQTPTYWLPVTLWLTSGHLTFVSPIFAVTISLSQISSYGGTFQRAVISPNFFLIRPHLHPCAQVIQSSFILTSYIFFSSFRYASYTFISTLAGSHLHPLLLLRTA